MSGSVLVTGASKGIGRACVERLSRSGFRVFAGARQDDDLKRLRSDSVVPVRLDVTDAATIASAAATIVDTVGEGGLQGLVNNAGIVLAGPLEGIPLEDLRYQFEVNVIGVVAVTQAVLPLLRSGRGRIVNISSINGRVAVPFAAPYAASKFALEAVSDGFRMELSRWDIPVTVIQPGAVDTPIWETTSARIRDVSQRLPDSVKGLYSGLLERIEERTRVPPHAVPADRVARLVERALTARRPPTRKLIGRDARIAALARFLLPDRLLDRMITKRRPSRSR